MKLRLIVFAVLAAFLILPATANAQAFYKSVEVTHFSQQEGVELSPEFPDFLYAALQEELGKTGLFGEVLGEGEVVDPADANRSAILQGTILEFAKGSKAKEYFIGFGAGRRTLVARVTVRRRSDQSSLFDRELKVRTSSFQDENLLAREIAKKIAKELKKGLKP